MSKNPNKKAVQKDEPMNGAMKFFLAGCVAELYLLILRRFYVNADSDVARFAWYDHYLWILAGIGAGVMAVCAIGALALRKDPKRRTALWAAAAAGLFVGAAALLVRLNMATLSFMSVVVPVIMILGILWALYDRECALALTVLGASLFVLWGVRRYGSSMYVGTAVKVCVVLYLVGLCGLRPVRAGSAGILSGNRRFLLRHVGAGSRCVCTGGLLHCKATVKQTERSRSEIFGTASFSEREKLSLSASRDGFH